MYKAQKGFTLIELVVVITILGILAAFAFPRFAALEVEAREAVTDGLAGSIRSASSLAHGLYLAQGSPATVDMEGNTINMVSGYPDAETIHLTLVDYTGFTLTTGATLTEFQTTGGPTGTCDVTYDEGGPPTIIHRPCTPTAACDYLTARARTYRRTQWRDRRTEKTQRGRTDYFSHPSESRSRELAADNRQLFSFLGG